MTTGAAMSQPTVADAIKLIDAEYDRQRAAYKRSGDSYHEGYLDGLERAALIVHRVLGLAP